MERFQPPPAQTISAGTGQSARWGALPDPALGCDCVAHARLFFNRPAFDLATAVPGSFALCPEGNMVDAPRRDYRSMTGMIFGTAPIFDAVIESIAALQNDLNATVT